MRIAILTCLLTLVNTFELNLNNADSVKTNTANLVYDMMTYYKGNLTGQTPGILPGPCQSVECYYWWQAGAMWSLLINYRQVTGDDSYHDTVIQALKHQIGPDANYNPPNQSKNMGVDDQDFWGFAAMEAAEAGIPDEPSFPSWLALAQAVWNFQYTLWDAATCGGGFRWQVYSFNGGYNLKNTISNGGFFQLSARLARYTGNMTYAEWADKTYDWMEQSLLFDEQADGYLYIWDNTDAELGCTEVEHFVWSYNYGVNLMGAAMMWNLTEDAKWKTRIDTIIKGAHYLFFPEKYGGSTMTEMLCEEPSNCNNDQSSFKAYLSRWMGVTALLAPWTYDVIMPKLRVSAMGAAGQCIGGNGRECGRRWYTTVWDGTKGVGQQMCALAAILTTQLTPAMAPLTLSNGGNSASNPNAGLSAPHNPEEELARNPITTADRAGAAILTIMVIALVIGSAIWLVL